MQQDVRDDAEFPHDGDEGDFSLFVQAATEYGHFGVVYHFGHKQRIVWSGASSFEGTAIAGE
ncbi:MAG: hypothetical protein OXC62_05690 [Aestuariivita sp.]|nr:hypothetical protein [Aestuariivita sp.]